MMDGPFEDLDRQDAAHMAGIGQGDPRLILFRQGDRVFVRHYSRDGTVTSADEDGAWVSIDGEDPQYPCRCDNADLTFATKASVITSKPERSSAFYSAATLKDKPVPERQWLVHGIVPQKTVTLFSGDGGTGKSLLALQLSVAVAAQTAWMGRPVQAGAALFMSAEDDEDELHRRLDDILRAEGRSYEDLSRLTMRSLAGESALLAIEDKIELVESELFRELEARAEDEGPALVVIDTLADVFPSNENDRAKVRQFVGILRGLALRQNCAVMLLAHPSLTGMNSGTGTSGSTAWNNSVRSRLYMQRVADETGYEPDPDKRVLSLKKANYGRTGEDFGLTWRAGVFVADAQETGLDRMARNAKAERVFLKLLRKFTETGQTLNHVSGPNYAPAKMAKHPDNEGMTKRALEPAMQSLLDSGAVRIVTEGSPSRQTSRLVEASE